MSGPVGPRTAGLMSGSEMGPAAPGSGTGAAGSSSSDMAGPRTLARVRSGSGGRKGRLLETDVNG